MVAYLGWLLAASALALLFALLIGELLALVGVVDPQSEAKQRVAEGLSIAGFIVLALLPFLLRGRLTRSDDNAR